MDAGTRWPRVALVAVVLLFALSSAVIAAPTGRLVTTYAALSPATASATVAAGLVLIAVGGFTWVSHLGGSVGALTMMIGAVWYAPLWVGWQGDAGSATIHLLPVEGPAVARSLGMVVATLMVPLLVHLVLAFPTGRLRARLARAAVGVCYAVAVLVGPVRVFLYDPFFDPGCWANCTTNPLLIADRPAVAKTLLDIGLVIWAVVGFLVALSALARLLGTTASGRRHTWGVLLPVAFAAVAEGVYAAAILVQMREDPKSPLFGSIFLARSAALTLLGIGLGWAALSDRRRSIGLARLADDLGNAPPVGSLSTRLADVLKDPGLTIGYWLADSEHYADASGRPFLPHPTAGQTVTSIHRASEPVAVIVHDRIRTDAGRLGQALGPAARMAIDNERLRAARLAQLRNLRLSRARIVEAGDEARRRLERDLHDGAQLHLMMVIYELLRVSAQAQREADGQQARALAVAIGEARSALAELREIAHGIFPVILEEAGLAPALETVAELAAVPVEIAEVPPQRFPSQVERAVYMVVASAAADAADDANRQPSDPVTVAVTSTPDHVIVEVSGVGECRDDHVADRVGSLGGALTHQRRRLRVEIPCG